MAATLGEGEWSAARPGRTLTPGKTRYPFTGGSVGPRAGLDGRKNLVPIGIRSRTVQLVVSRSGFSTRPIYMGYVVENVALGHVLIPGLRCSLVIVIPPKLYVRSSTYRRL